MDFISLGASYIGDWWVEGNLTKLNVGSLDNREWRLLVVVFSFVLFCLFCFNK